MLYNYIPQQMKMQLRKMLKEDNSKFAHVLPCSASFLQLNHEYLVSRDY